MRVMRSARQHRAWLLKSRNWLQSQPQRLTNCTGSSEAKDNDADGLDPPRRMNACQKAPADRSRHQIAAVALSCGYAPIRIIQPRLPPPSLGPVAEQVQARAGAIAALRNDRWPNCLPVDMQHAFRVFLPPHQHGRTEMTSSQRSANSQRPSVEPAIGDPAACAPMTAATDLRRKRPRPEHTAMSASLRAKKAGVEVTVLPALKLPGLIFVEDPALRCFPKEGAILLRPGTPRPGPREAKLKSHRRCERCSRRCSTCPRAQLRRWRRHSETTPA